MYQNYMTKNILQGIIELVKVGCNVILDWGFWTFDERNRIAKYFKDNKIKIEWHYIDIEDILWNENIEERNRKVQEGSGGSEFYVTEELKNKVLSLFEIPSKEEIDIWYKFER